MIYCFESKFYHWLSSNNHFQHFLQPIARPHNKLHLSI
nr:MAG TPA: hypothetical protein [Caudoviricetes sp.]